MTPANVLLGERERERECVCERGRERERERESVCVCVCLLQKREEEKGYKHCIIAYICEGAWERDLYGWNVKIF